MQLPMKTDIKGRTALHCAAFLGYVEMTATLIDIVSFVCLFKFLSKHTINNNNNTESFFKCANAIEARDKEGNTPLMLACWAKRAQVPAPIQAVTFVMLYVRVDRSYIGRQRCRCQCSRYDGTFVYI